MTTTEIREALLAVERAVEVPPVDQVAFQARVRAERRRRTAGRVLVCAAAAAVAVAAAGITGNALLGGPDRGPGPGPATQSEGEGEGELRVPGATFYFVHDGRLAALDPRGVVHDLGQRSEGVIGWNGERVYAFDGESRVTVHRVEYDDEGAQVARFTEEESPVGGPVQRAELSGDGRYLAWLDLENVVHRYDLKAEREDMTIPVSANTLLTGVAAEGVLLSEDGALSVRDDESGIPIPVRGPADSFASDLAMGLVLVNDRDGRARLYDISDGSARLVDEVVGEGLLGPYAKRIAVIVPEPEDRARVEMWDGGTMLDLQGLEEVVPTTLRWADESVLLVAGYDGGQGLLYACDIERRCMDLPVEGQVNLS